MAIGFAAAGEREEFFLEFARDRSGDAFADLDFVDGADGRDFDGRAAEEDFVDDVEHFAGDDLFFHRNVQIFGQRDDGVTCDAGQNAGGERRRVQRAVVNEKYVHAGALADMAARIQGDALGVAVERGFHADELRVHVVRGSLGHGRESVWRNAGPGADAYFDAFCEGFRAEIGAPGPAGHINVDGGVERIHADFAVAAEDDGLDVARSHFVEANQFGCGIGEIIEGEGQLHAVNFRGIDQALHVLTEPEKGRALLGFVAADALEDRGAVAHNVRKDMEGGVFPVYPLSVVPDFFGLLDGHDGVLFVAPLAAEPEKAGYGTRRRASNNCIQCCGQCKNQIGAYGCRRKGGTRLFRRIRAFLSIRRWRGFLRTIQRIESRLSLRRDIAVLVLPEAEKKERNGGGDDQEFGFARHFDLWLPAKKLRGQKKSKNGP